MSFRRCRVFIDNIFNFFTFFSFWLIGIMFFFILFIIFIILPYFEILIWLKWFITSGARIARLRVDILSRRKFLPGKNGWSIFRRPVSGSRSCIQDRIKTSENFIVSGRPTPSRPTTCSYKTGSRSFAKIIILKFHKKIL